MKKRDFKKRNVDRRNAERRSLEQQNPDRQDGARPSSERSGSGQQDFGRPSAAPRSFERQGFGRRQGSRRRGADRFGRPVRRGLGHFFFLALRWATLTLVLFLIIVATWAQPIAPDDSEVAAVKKEATGLWQVGDEVPPELFTQGASLSAGSTLETVPGQSLFLSQVPVKPQKPGILTRVDNVISKSGDLRVLYAHYNALADYGKEVKNISAQMGLVFVNNTRRTVDVYYKRLGKGVNRLSDGTRLYLEDMKPLTPGETIPEFTGSQLGNIVMSHFLKPAPEEKLWGTMNPGGRVWLYEQTGPQGWAIIMGDFVFRDRQTGEVLTLDRLKAGEQIGIRSFIARSNTDLEQFFTQMTTPSAVLTSDQSTYHQRGLITEGITRKKSFTYNAANDGVQTITIGSAFDAQRDDPAKPNYDPTKFSNDAMQGADAYGFILKNQAKPRKTENNGAYGAIYEFTLTMEGPTALAIQGSVAPADNPKIADVDIYNQFITASCDEGEENIRTVRISDPKYMEYYRNPDKLRPVGSGKVLYVFPDEGTQTHVIRIGLAPNSQGPWKLALVPLKR
ncbi:hypothetical protein [Heliophilum fasciatum]|uniref:Uncharacterized protein n=1 Tax=Heliophilum fasciatum TaxID=35700 RepID=A0A4R2RMI4_9FIRM|nr:hypothetical protein [Heliophilum fasciatum]MCW2278254.1 hypothetical protein [Heliophilum fasciatum]TCP63879.1 hypothetical protein EDD73_11426 [Heliophilum fasciatum]